MRKVLFKKYIPPVYEKSGQFTNKVKEGTGKWKENFNVEGSFLHWGVDYEELQNGAGTYTVCFVELKDGTVEKVLPSNIKFL